MEHWKHIHIFYYIYTHNTREVPQSKNARKVNYSKLSNENEETHEVIYTTTAQQVLCNLKASSETWE